MDKKSQKVIYPYTVNLTDILATLWSVCDLNVIVVKKNVMCEKKVSTKKKQKKIDVGPSHTPHPSLIGVTLVHPGDIGVTRTEFSSNPKPTPLQLVWFPPRKYHPTNFLTCDYKELPCEVLIKRYDLSSSVGRASD